MNIFFKKLQDKLFGLGEGIGVAILATLFGTFLLQIISRYVFASPISWSVELCLTLWLWLVFWGNTFVVDKDEHVTFSVLYQAVGRRTRAVFALISAVLIVTTLAVAFLPTLDFITFLKIKKSAGLRLPMDRVFFVYILFIISAILTYSYHLYVLIRHGHLKEQEIPSDPSFFID